MTTFSLIITTPERIVYQDSVESVSLPTVDGEITVMANHVPMVSVLKAGEMILRKGGETLPYAVGGGFVEIDGQKVTVLADTAEHAAEIDEQKAEEARQRALTLKEEKRQDTEEYAAIASKLERDLARLHVVRKYKHRGHQGIPYEGIRHD